MSSRWFDADSVVANIDLPVEIFLPPDTHDRRWDATHLLVTNDHNGLNTGVFFLRVHEWSIRFLVKAMAFPMFHPAHDLGASSDQRAMELVLEEKDFAASTASLPKPWFNAYPHDFVSGNLLVHFAGMPDRESIMQDWLRTTEAAQVNDEGRQVAEDRLLNETTAFWRDLSLMRGTTSLKETF